ncbi:MAG: FecR domain-containing protein [Treponema sp.]|nr:FecR domain-containing protein [Treponema sp.]
MLFFTGFRSYAQEGGGAWVYTAEGGGFVLIAGGQHTAYRAEDLRSGGFSLHTGDIIQTGPGTFVEILLNPGGRVLKVSENTSFSYNIITGEARISLGLSYGRMRLADGKSGSGGPEIFIRSETAEAVFRGGDIGVDYIMRMERDHALGGLALRVYAFSGSADIFPLIRGSPADHPEHTVPRFQVNAPEEIAIEITASLASIERKPLGGDIIAYWDRHTSAAFSLLSPEEPVSPPETASPGKNPETAGQNWTISPQDNPYIRSNAVKNGFLTAGLSLSFIGAILEGVAQWDSNTGHRDNRNLSRYTGYGFLGLGALCFAAALFINPKLPVSDAAE